ncbi:MAG: penicillin acylase family protein, partial [Pseudomonadales bacterium]
MAQHGAARWKGHLRRFSAQDERLVDDLADAYRALDPAIAKLLFPDAKMPAVPSSGSNNWAVRGERSASGMPMLATDPHQEFSIPNTFFYVHLSAPDFDVFGASFPGMPYFMMGHTRRIAWGLTTGFTDNYDVYIEALESPDSTRYRTAAGHADLDCREELVRVKDGDDLVLPVARTRHGPLFEPLLEALGLAAPRSDAYRTALQWTLGNCASSAGTLARLPLARNAREFGEYLFEDEVTPLVNNIICVDADNDLRRWIVATLPKRSGVTGVLPLPGWDGDYDFELSRASDMLVEHNPESGVAATANNDTMEERGEFPIHNYPAHSARADRIFELLDKKGVFTLREFQAMQLDLLDRRAAEIIPDVLELLAEVDDAAVVKGRELLAEWDCCATPQSSAACVYYGLLNSRWHETFLKRALEAAKLDTSLLPVLRVCAGLASRWQIEDFLAEGSPWAAHRDLLRDAVASALRTVIARLCKELGEDTAQWQWGRINQIEFWHTLRGEKTFEHLVAGPSPIGGSPNTLAMARHMGKGPGVQRDVDEPAYRTMHGPVFRMVVDLADPTHPAFVICGGNSARPQSRHLTDMFPLWLAGDYAVVRLERDEIDRSPETVWDVE